MYTQDTKENIFSFLLKAHKEFKGNPRESYALASCQNRLNRIDTLLSLSKAMKKDLFSNEFVRLAQLERDTILTILKKLNLDFKEIANDLSSISSDEIKPLTRGKVTFENKDNAEFLVINTDLLRDYDDWNVIINLIISNKYKNIFIVTSNENQGTCAEVTTTLIPALVDLSKQLHGQEINISVYQGLEAFDFAAGVHELKGYSASMRMEKIKYGTASMKKSYIDLYNDLEELGNKKIAFDCISIGKIADHHILWTLYDSLDLVPNQDIVLGAKPGDKGTNSNHPPQYLTHLRDGVVMLDSRYGKDLSIRKELLKILFVDYRSELLHFNENIDLKKLNINELYFYHMLHFLHEVGTEASQILLRATIQHLEKMEYGTGSFYDVYTSITAQYPAVEKTKQCINLYDNPENLEHPIWSFNSLQMPLIHQVVVYYPVLETLEQLKTKTLFNNLEALGYDVNGTLSKENQKSCVKTFWNRKPVVFNEDSTPRWTKSFL